MNNIQIEFSKSVSDSKIFEKSEYVAKTDDGEFESTVVVSKYKDEPTYVNQIKCVKGESKLNHYEFWSRLQRETLKVHNRLKQN